MCEAIQEMIDEARQQGREEKEKEMCQGLKEMIDEARQRAIEQTMDMLNVPEEQRKILREQMAGSHQ